MSKNRNKFMVGAVTAAMVATAIAPAAGAEVNTKADNYSDVSVENSHFDNIYKAKELGLLQGSPDGTFKPADSLTRSNVVKALGKYVVKESGKTLETYDVSGVKAFDDVPSSIVDKELYNYSLVVKKAGIFSGDSNKLNPLNKISRQQMAKVLVNTFGLEDLEDKKSIVTDNKEAFAEFVPYINILSENGVTTQKEFMPKEGTSRAQFASFLVRSYDASQGEEVELDVESVKAINSSQIVVELTDGEKYTINLEKGERLTVGKNELTVTIDGEDYDVEVYYEAPEVEDIRIVDADTITVFFDNDENFTIDIAPLKDGDNTVKFTINGADYTEVITYTAPKAEVASVSAINATQVEVKFNEAVDEADAETVGKVTIQGVDFASRTLSEDGKTLTLVATAPIDVENAAVVVEPIKTKADAKMLTEKFVSLVTYEDVVKPVLTGVEAKTNGSTASTVKVTVSEPVKTGALVKINGAYANVDFAGTNEATISGIALETGKTHTIELINLEDLAGNKTVTTSANFTVSVDTTAPTATLTSRGDKEILVTFNESVTASTVQSALANGSVKNELLEAVETGAVSVVPNTNNTQFVIPVLDTLYANQTSRTLTVVLSDTITDVLGNKLVATTQKVTLTKDAVKPVTTGYTVTKDAAGKVTAIEVNFSEGLSAANANTITAPTVVSENGVAVTNFLGGLKSAAVTAGDKKVVFTATTPAEVTGKYAFSFANELVSDQAETANKSAAFNYTIDFGKGESVTTFDLTSATTTSTNVVTVAFPEAVKGGAVANSATDISNYTLAGKPLPAGTTITLDADQKVATITLPAESIVKTDQAAIFTASNIKNTAGTKTVKSYTGTLAVTDNVSPIVQSARILDNKTIELTYSEAIALNGTLVGDEFTITQGSTALTLADIDLTASEVSGFPTKVRVSLTSATLDLAQTISLTTKTPAIADVEDVEGNDQKVGVQLTVAK